MKKSKELNSVMDIVHEVENSSNAPVSLEGYSRALVKLLLEKGWVYNGS
jgi:hypothetical protein